MKAAVACLVLCAGAHGAVPEDEVLSMPRYDGPAIKFRHYSGYLDASPSKHLHYWLVESERDPANDPVILWLNGGPGCSSLYGAFRELGPFKHNFEHPYEDKGLYYNPHAWNQQANVLFVESPVGVGFSWSADSADYTNNDTGTAQDNYAMLQDFYAKFPELRDNEFFISGESYAGMYIPTLADEIRRGQAQFPINLKGLLIGNGVTHPDFDSTYTGHAEFYRGRGVISEEIYSDIVEHCRQGTTPADPNCISAVLRMQSCTQGLNRYQIFTPCHSTPFNPEIEVATWEMDGMEASVGEVPCVDGRQQNDYLRDPEVIKALHVEEGAAANGNWVICSNRLRYSKNLGSDSYQFYPELLQEMRIWKFYGDTDAAVVAPAGEGWTRLLAEEEGYDLTRDWSRWTADFPDYNPQSQVAGYVKEWSNGTLAYITVKGGWHTVPESNPVEALYMVNRFLEDKPL